MKSKVPYKAAGILLVLTGLLLAPAQADKGIKPPPPCSETVFVTSRLATYEGSDEAAGIAVFRDVRTGVRIDLPIDSVSKCFVETYPFVHITVTQESENYDAPAH